jgi:flagellar motor switch protein FliN
MPEEVKMDSMPGRQSVAGEGSAESSEPVSSPQEPSPGVDDPVLDDDGQPLPTFEDIGMFRKDDDDASAENGADPAAGSSRQEDRFPDLSGVGAAPSFAQRAEFQQLAPSSGTESFHNNIDLLLDVKMPVAIELGRTELPIAELLTLGPGSVIELNKLAGEPVDLLVNNKIIARGEVVVVDENFGVRVTSLLSPEERIKSLAME